MTDYETDNIIYSSMTTPDGTVLVSRHRHDYKFHQDLITDKYYFLDGGNDYIRCSCNGDEVFNTLTLDTSHDIAREYVTWGTYGKSGTDPLRIIKVKDIEDDHLDAIISDLSKTKLELDDNKSNADKILKVMLNEKAYRNN